VHRTHRRTLLAVGVAVAVTLVGLPAANAQLDGRAQAPGPAAAAAAASTGAAPASTGTPTSTAPAGSTAAPAPSAAPASSGPLTVADAPGSVAYLRATYQISEPEALRRLALQRAATLLAPQLAARFPDQYAGLWLDQSGGGVLRVAMTTPSLLDAALSGVTDAEHITAVPATHSLRDLRAAAARIAGRTGLTAGVDVLVDPVRNAVVVPTGRRVRASDARLLAALDAERAVRVETRPVGTGRDKTACDPRFCAKAPMRGGIRLDVTRDDGSFGGCTSGYNLVSATGERYVLTAGHCVDSSRHQNIDQTYHQRLGVNWPVGVEIESLSINAYPTDYAIMPFQAGALARWSGLRPKLTAWYLVNSWCPGGCAGSHDVAISGFTPLAEVLTGAVACATGSGYTPQPGETYVDSGAGLGYLPGTRCGEVTGTATGGIDMRICARPGDSGGPLFTEVDGKALGILSFGDDGSGPCTNPAEMNHYVAVSTILTHANSVSGLGFRLVTAPVRTPIPRRPAPSPR
jgi:hypothetical protein